MSPLRNTISLRDGTIITMPRLVPSFSSKGFPIFKDKEKKKYYSDTTYALEGTAEFINDSMLLSAYDIHHKYFRQPERYLKGKELIFIDSGGYELSTDYDSTEPKQPKYKPRVFDDTKYQKILNRLPNDQPIVITNFDTYLRRMSIVKQIIAAQQLFNNYKHFLHDFIIKPPRKGEYLEFNDIYPHIEKLNAFDIIGMAEKDLDIDLNKRIEVIAKLRTAMDRAGVKIPIHIWGGLDPIITPLYYFAGAEIFDGVSWLRYAYWDGIAVYRDSAGILNPDWGVGISTEHTRGLVINHNLIFLRNLTTGLRKFSDGKAKSFKMFGKLSKVFKKAYEDLLAEIPEIKEVHHGR